MGVVKQNIYLILKYQFSYAHFRYLLYQKESAAFQLRIHILSLSSPIHLPPVMPPDAPYRLSQGIRPAVLVVGMRSLVLVEYDHRPLLRIFRVMQIPVMSGIAAHDRHIIGICCYDGEILRIQVFQIFITKHEQPPSRQTTHPEPS